MATAKRTTFSGIIASTVSGFEGALAELRKDGAPDDAAVALFSYGTGWTLKGEWSVEVPDPAEPAPDERPQPEQAK